MGVFTGMTWMGECVSVGECENTEYGMSGSTSDVRTGGDE